MQKLQAELITLKGDVTALNDTAVDISAKGAQYREQITPTIKSVNDVYQELINKAQVNSKALLIVVSSHSSKVEHVIHVIQILAAVLRVVSTRKLARWAERDCVCAWVDPAPGTIRQLSVKKELYEEVELHPLCFNVTIYLLVHYFCMNMILK